MQDGHIDPAEAATEIGQDLPAARNLAAAIVVVMAVILMALIALAIMLI